MTRGEKVCAFIEKYLIVPQGDLIGEPIKLLPFQRKFLLDIYDNPVGTRQAYLSLAKKNGKTSLIAGVLLAHLAGPEARQNAQIVSGAQSRDQAAQVFDLACQMIQASDVLSRLIRIVPSNKKLIGLARNVTFKALSAEGRTAHGMSPYLALLDEIGQVRGPTDAFVSAVTTSQDAYSDSLLICFSTQAATDNDLFSQWLDAQERAPDPRTISHVYRADEDCDIQDRKQWFAANPALGVFKSLEKFEGHVSKAIEIPTLENEFRNFHLNQRIETFSPFVSRDQWKANNATPGSLEGKKVYCGLDLAAVNDLAAFVAVSEEDFDVVPTFWLPKDGLSEKSRKDHVPYDLWAREGYLQTTPGKSIEYEYVANFLRGFFDRHDVVAVGFDRYNMRFLRPWLVAAGFSDAELEKFQEFGQGTASMTPALRELESKLINGRMKHGDHPVLSMCAANATVSGDSGARKFVKHKDSRRIDGMVALAMAVGVMPTEAKPPKEYKIMVFGGKK